MATKTIDGLTGLGANVAAGDLFEIADISAANASLKVTQLQIVQGLTITPTTGTFTLTSGKTVAVSNTLTFTGTDSSTVAFGAGGTVIYSGGNAGTPSALVGTNITAIPTKEKITAANYTVGTTSAQELWGGIIYVTGACTITIPAVAAGQSFAVRTIGDVAVSVDPNASDLIVLDGVPLSDGDKVTNLSTAGDEAVFTYYDATGWYCSTNGWTDGN